MKAVNKGFTLIELMIVVAVIGVLAAIAIPQYQKYVAKSEFASAYGSLAAAKTNLDDYVISNGAFPTNVSQIGLSASAAMGTISVTSASSSINYAINAASPDAKGKTVQLIRGSDGWSCSVTGGAEQALLPKGCTASK
ncbi:MAG: pilin [Shewanella sp.]|uniref:pilin n=1 Tax=Plesiomonas shigelloides TaxID=703 RepID=UPI002B0030F1|nr:pilin [Plesiomonas shigelloides]